MESKQVRTCRTNPPSFQKMIIVSFQKRRLQAIRFAGLDYKLEKRKLFTCNNENQNGNPDTDIITAEIEVPNYFATVRTDSEQVLGVVGKDYEVVQNEDAFLSLMRLSAEATAFNMKPREHWEKENLALWRYRTTANRKSI